MTFKQEGKKKYAEGLWSGRKLENKPDCKNTHRTNAIWPQVWIIITILDSKTCAFSDEGPTSGIIHCTNFLSQ